MDKEEKIRIFEETLECSKNFSYVNPDGRETEILKEDYKMSFNDMTIYDRNIYAEVKKMKREKFDTIVEVIPKDCLYAAEELVNEYYFPAVLNMASFKNPGGGVTNGSSAQEESLCRRTNLYLSISRFADTKKKIHYPLDINYGAIYSPVISVFRKSEADGCEFLEYPFTVDVITAAAIKNPKLNPDGTFEQKTREILRNKIRTIFNLGIYWKNDSLVLGAFGCGAYGTPPYEMAALFKEVMNEPIYKNAFKKIVFAIIDDKNAHREHNPEGNYLPFKKTFGC